MDHVTRARGDRDQFSADLQISGVAFIPKNLLHSFDNCGSTASFSGTAALFSGLLVLSLCYDDCCH